MRLGLSTRRKLRRIGLRERRKLRHIGKAIGRSDPWLASWLATFSRLAADDAMPTHERLAATPARLSHRSPGSRRG